MSEVFLESMVADIPTEILPLNWQTFDLVEFSRNKNLWDYQQKAVENALKVLWKYYGDFHDYRTQEPEEVNQDRKQKFYHWYEDNGLVTQLDIPLNKNRGVRYLLEDYYESCEDKIPYFHFINRACFWMATGSGKTLVIVKLIEVLRELIRRGEMPPNDILVLTHRDDLISQLKAHVVEFNSAHNDLYIRLRELREYAVAKRESPSLFKDKELTVFYYRSDNLSDEQKEKIIDFRNYDNDGKWFVFLDEAHKGDKEDSKRQHIYSILSRNGFLFNFSATFTDPRDLATTVCNFNLAEFIKTGYGKHISILKQELRAFKVEDDFSKEEKQKVVLKSLLMLAYARKYYEGVRVVDSNLYHKPLLLTLVNSVSTEDADLELFFREVERIGKGETTATLWQTAKAELWEEFKQLPEFMFEEASRFEVDQKVFDGLSVAYVLQSVYNASSAGDIEILIRPTNRKELALKLKTGDLPFALIKIGDISGWLKEKLTGYEINERFEDEDFFESLNYEDSDINILMGSRSFYEGWDSNRPNVINFINIGVGVDAKKFILQSVGRGVRIEPLKDKRKRLLPLYNSNEVPPPLFQSLNDLVKPLETLVIFGTNRQALQTVIGQLKQETKGEWQQLSLFVNDEVGKQKLLIPTYKEADYPLSKVRSLSKFPITTGEFQLLKRYLEYVDDDRVLLALYESEPIKVSVLRTSLNTPDDFYKQDGRSYNNVNLMVRRVLDYFSIYPQEFDTLKPLDEEIRHFKHISVSLKDISELQSKIEKVRQYQAPTAMVAELKQKYSEGEISLNVYTERIQHLAKFVPEDTVSYSGKKLKIRKVANHYYVPVLLSDEVRPSGEIDKINYIKHIIQEDSEVKFLNRLEQYLESPENQFKQFDWWFFSKLDESLDEVYIPYYDPKLNRIRRFKPDFIFWLQKGDDYRIFFIDPKGISHTDYQYKVDGFKSLFEDEAGDGKVLCYENLKVKVSCFLFTSDINQVPEGYRRYWFDSLKQVLVNI